MELWEDTPTVALRIFDAPCLQVSKSLGFVRAGLFLRLGKSNGGAGSPTLKRAKRRTEMFSPSLPILVAISCAMLTV